MNNTFNTPYDMTDTNFEWVATIDNTPVYIWEQAKIGGGACTFWDPVNGYQIFVTREIFNNKPLYMAFLHHELAHVKNEDPKRNVLNAMAAIERGEEVAEAEDGIHLDISEEIAADAHAKACGYGEILKTHLLVVLGTTPMTKKYEEAFCARIRALMD